ncbi:hypothetical protein F5Y03DRAFT_65853 [Xylaria venustula]|nr:hypothetical protein F5Y03DRAFT_65853 [Xylaria venustula]
MQPSISDNLQHYYLPIGVLGLANQFINIYIYCQCLLGNRPLLPSRKLRLKGYNTFLCCAIVVFILGFDIASLRRLHRWELIASVVANLIISLNNLAMVIAAMRLVHDELKKAEDAVSGHAGADADGTSSETTTLHGDEPPPPYSKDPEIGDAVTNDQRKVPSHQAPSHEINCTSDRGVGLPEHPTSGESRTQTQATESSSTLAEKKKEATDFPTAQSQAETKEKIELSTSGFVFFVVFQLPGAALLFASLVSQLTHHLPAGWSTIDHIRPIIIIQGIFVVGTALATIAGLVRVRRAPAPSCGGSTARKRSQYLGCLFMGGAGLNFCLIMFDKLVLAALAGDIGGAKHILSDGGLPLVYMILTKLPALAL